MCRMLPLAQNELNYLPVKHFASSEVMVLGTPNRANSSWILVMNTVAVPALTSNTSNHLEVASTITQNSLFLYGPKKSTCKRVHTCSGHFHGVSTAFGGVDRTCMQLPEPRIIFDITVNLRPPEIQTRNRLHATP